MAIDREDDRGGLGFWMFKLEERLRADEKAGSNSEKWAALRAHLATQLTNLQDKVEEPSRIGEVFEYAVQVVRYWLKKAGGDQVGSSEITNLYEWGLRLSPGLPEGTIDGIGQSIRDAIMGAKPNEVWQPKPARMHQRPKGRRGL